MGNTSAPRATDTATPAGPPEASVLSEASARPASGRPLWLSPGLWPVQWLVSALLLGTFVTVLVLQLGFAYGFYGQHLLSNEEAAAREKAAVLAQTVVAAKSRLTKTVTDYAPWSLSIGYLDQRITEAARKDAESGARLDRLMLDVDAFLDPDLINGERTQQIRLTGEDHGSDAVIGPLRKEVVDDALAGLPARYLGTRRAHIQGHHRPRKVDDHHDVEAFGLAFNFLVRRPRASEGDDEERRSEQAEEGAESAALLAHGATEAVEERCVRVG